MSYYDDMKIKAEIIKKKDIITILAIETSCDETSVAIVENGRNVLSNVIASQIDIHKKFGGVVPEVASRKHLETINGIIDEALTIAGKTLDDIDVIGVTKGPGLVGALLVGVSTAKALAYSLKKPLIGVHHIEGHIAANYIEYKELKPPFLCLVVSGGHTHIVMVKGYCSFDVIGQTRDDAVGEAYDKVARVIGLPYPGGPYLDKLAMTGNANAYKFPRPYIKESHMDFSFSGLKTAVINEIHKIKQRGEEYKKEDIADSFQQAVIDILCAKVNIAIEKYDINKLAIAGGVAANQGLRNAMTNLMNNINGNLYIPQIKLCTDNAAMIGSCAYYRLLNDDLSDMNLDAVPYLPL